MGFFYDPSDGGPLKLELLSINGTRFRVLQRMAYRSDQYDAPFEFPSNLDDFRTDLASVPDLFTWLVPRTGDFLPAAVLHDALLVDDYRGPKVARADADDIFRIAMDELGTGRVRAWLMWSAVSAATMWHSGRLAQRVAVAGFIGVIVLLGVVASLDLVDIWNVLPWMGERPWWIELLTGIIAAVVIPAVLALSWGNRWRAGTIAGVSLALLIHVTLVLAALFSFYRFVEFLVSGRRRADGVYPQRRKADAPGRPH